MKKGELKKAIERGLGGMPEIKAIEKKKWLGEFRERVILGLTVKQCSDEYSLHHVQEALKDSMAEKLIVNNKMSIDAISRYMRLADKMEKDFISRTSQCEDAMGVVVASSVAVNREDIEDETNNIPTKFADVKKGKLCRECLQELRETDKKRFRDFTRITLLDKILGAKCVVCNKK
ncbi:MAG: DUF1694 domain-containing protein [Alkaliphilus sp.]